MYYLYCENIVTAHLTAKICEAVLSCFWHMQSRFPHGVAQMQHVQIRDLRVTHGSPLCLLIDV